MLFFHFFILYCGGCAADISWPQQQWGRCALPSPHSSFLVYSPATRSANRSGIWPEIPDNKLMDPFGRCFRLIMPEHALSLIMPYSWGSRCSNTLALRNKPCLPGVLSTLQSHYRFVICHKLLQQRAKQQHSMRNTRSIACCQTIMSLTPSSAAVHRLHEGQTHCMWGSDYMKQTKCLPAHTSKAVKRSSQILGLLQEQARHAQLTLCLITALLLLQVLLTHVMIRVWRCTLSDFWLHVQ